MKRGFTLVELLVVIGIMGMLATVSIGGYSAVTRGMAERGAIDAAAGAAEIAFQRAKIDRTRTYLYLFNEVLRLDSEDNVGLVSGVAVAVRPVGRFTRVSGSEFYDEFGDLNQSYSALEEESRDASASEKEQSAASVTIYNLRTRETSTVREGVYRSPTVAEPDLEDANGKTRDLCAYGFKKISGASFEVGDAYGQEFAVMRLPPGYVFSSSVTMASSSDLGRKLVDVREILPTHGSAPSIEVFSRRPDGSFKSVGSTSQSEDVRR